MFRNFVIHNAIIKIPNKSLFYVSAQSTPIFFITKNEYTIGHAHQPALGYPAKLPSNIRELKVGPRTLPSLKSHFAGGSPQYIQF